MIVCCVDIGGIVDHHCINMSNFASMFRRFAVLATKEPKIMWVCNLLALSVHDVKEFEDTKGGN